MFNKYLNASGKGFIMIKAASDCVVAGKNYLKGQLITTISEADYEISYRSLNKTTTSKTFLLGTTDYEPITVEIRAQNLSETLADLLFTEKELNPIYEIPEIESQISNNSGNIILTNMPKTGTVFVYNAARDLVTGWSIDSMGLISGLDVNTKYFITYYVETSLDILYRVSKNSIPYVQLEIVNKGNVGGKGRSMYLNIPRASLEIEPVLNFTMGQIASIPLKFNILDGNMKLGIY